MSFKSNSESKSTAMKLNALCHCITLDRDLLSQVLADETADTALAALVLERASAMFSNVAVFALSSVLAQMTEVIEAIVRVTQTHLYQKEVLERAPLWARLDHGPAGVFMGFDFHVGHDGPQLIEINTNAGGAFLNAALGRAHQECCSRMDSHAGNLGGRGFEPAVLKMFEREWRSQRKSGRLGRIAIVDDQPQNQALYPEFLLAQSLFRRNGIEAVIAGPDELILDSGKLLISGEPIDLVYNRLVDFQLSAEQHQVLRLGYEMGAAVITPNPRNHALYADKRNLVLLSDAARLRDWGVDSRDLEILSKAIPRAQEMTPTNADRIWRDRKKSFFKPFAGYASKAVYRGDKVTSARWAEIRTGGYIAQEFAEPGERMVALDGELLARKVDFRLYAYEVDTLLTAARVYQGQTTNMRTPGGGFAPVLVVEDGVGSLTSCEAADTV